MRNATPSSCSASSRVEGEVLILDCGIWEHTKKERLKPPYTRLKRVNLLHERNMPCIYSSINVHSSYDWKFETAFLAKNANVLPYFNDQCERCWQYTFVIDVTRGIQICLSCKHIISENVSSRSSFTDSHGPCLPNKTDTKPILPRRHTTSLYKRINHFHTWIQRLSGESISRITPQEEEDILCLFSKYGITDPTFDQVRYVLRKNKYQHQYNNTFYIMTLVSGTKPFEFKEHHIQKLVDRFRTIHETFTSSRGNRVNMLSYIYLIRKFCELEGWDHIASCLPGIKCQGKLYSQDKIWKTVCEKHGFKFIRSV